MSFVEEINTSDKGLKLFYEATFKLRNQSSFFHPISRDQNSLSCKTDSRNHLKFFVNLEYK